MRFDGCDLFGQRGEQKQRVLTLCGEGAVQGQGSELELAARGEKFWAEAQAMTESDGLQAVAQHSADAHQAMTIAQQCQNIAAGGRRNVNGGKIIVGEQVEQELRVAPIIFLTAAGELANG